MGEEVSLSGGGESCVDFVFPFNFDDFDVSGKCCCDFSVWIGGW